MAVQSNEEKEICVFLFLGPATCMIRPCKIGYGYCPNNNKSLTQLINTVL